MSKKGTISVQTNDIFPIIKKWLYSEHDIFIRELVANATDAITKRASLARTLNQEIPTGKITVEVSKKDKTIKIHDNGLGMSEAEVEKYIAQLAFSGAQEFVEKMKDDKGDTQDIIGKFGLGFYSAFMVSNKVEVDSLSMNEGAKATHWECEGETDYIFDDSKKDSVGTTITLHVNTESEEFLSSYKLEETIRKFCEFMPEEIYVLDLDQEPAKNEDGTITPVAPRLINETTPLWKRDPKELKDEDYIGFFKKLYPMEQEPLFWIHLNVDHPFTLNGILYFPKVNMFKAPTQEKNIRLFCRQVFVSENVKNVIPEFLSLLKGAIDSPDIPLNVSRSSLQGDPNVRRISNYVVKKVAESLKILFNKDREKFETIWEDIGLFVKYGCISDDKFDELMRARVIFPSSGEKMLTLDEYQEGVNPEYKEKIDKTVLYYEKANYNESLLNQLKEEKVFALSMDDHIDPHFMQHVEFKKLEKDKSEYKFSTVESELSNILGSENTNEEDIKIKEFFEQIILGKVSAPKADTDSDKETKSEMPNPLDGAQKEIQIEKLKNVTSPAYLKVDESMKRFAKMSQSMGGGAASFPVKKTLVINPNNPLIQNAYKMYTSGKNVELAKKIAHHVEDLANIGSEGLGQENKDNFIQRSQDIIKELSALAL
ncbi:molecular chaperone HtpG [bacterium]|nr:molecular chaperone HtpG [bacterium]